MGDWDKNILKIGPYDALVKSVIVYDPDVWKLTALNERTTETSETVVLRRSREKQ